MPAPAAAPVVSSSSSKSYSRDAGGRFTGKATGVGSAGFTPPSGVSINKTFETSRDMDFRKSISDTVSLSGPDMCFVNTPLVAAALNGIGIKTAFSYDPTADNGRGHVWTMAQNPKDGKWQAVDPQYGPIINDPSYYKAPYTFDDYSKLDAIEPGFSVAIAPTNATAVAANSRYRVVPTIEEFKRSSEPVAKFARKVPLVSRK